MPGPRKPAAQSCAALLIAGVAGVVAGYAWHHWFPIYKPLWTSSYVLFTAGAACLLLALCWWLIEMRGWRLWSRPFLWLGSNAILAYALSTFFAKLGSIIKVPDGATRSTYRPGSICTGLSRWRRRKMRPWPSPSAYVAVWTLVAWGFTGRRFL